jgi:hypothetical protein
MYPTFEGAKSTCARRDCGILDFIKFGADYTSQETLIQLQDDDVHSVTPPITLTVQGFFKALLPLLPEPPSMTKL